ncbi:MAG: carboxylesterase/lipase family protein [Haliscomenobacter sp.]|nr:carboxylesterase family protein [Haliscomenobacter sp.]MBK9492698.1 carboxylesterase/lipase family protein [Haliscomenobacter sp.]
MKKVQPNRRSFFKTLSAGAAAFGLGSPFAFASNPDKLNPAKEDDQVLFIGDNIAIANTSHGKVRGFILRNIYHFIGIPYGADTSGANRFMPPQKPKPWTDVYPAIWWGNSAPQQMENRYANKFASFRDQWNYDDVSEDCLHVNVFTPGYADGKKRPVLLWMHGGGFWNGNSIEHEGYKGENLARLGDVVFCSVNHRLGPLGFTDLSTVGGDKYAASGNVGMLDLVAALEWVHENIANFGGDPNNVTIMGQSGGGAKVCTTTAMPAAQGLFSKAVVLSGARLDLGNPEFSKKLGAYILKEAGLQAAQVDQLQQMPWKAYFDLSVRAAEKLVKDAGKDPAEARQIFQPRVDGKHIPHNPYLPQASPYAAKIPMMICSVTNESSNTWMDASRESISLQGLKDQFKRTYGEKAGAIVDAYARAFPAKKPAELSSMITNHRQRSVLLADSKSKQEAPVYLAWFGWQPPLFDNRLRAFHCLDICFWFYNTDLMLPHTGGGARPRALSQKMAGALLNFMKTGDPNGAGLPKWPKYSTEKGETMFLDDTSSLQLDPDREARQALPPYSGY